MNEGIEMECPRCHYKWTYKGSRRPEEGYPVYVSCPKCKTSVQLPKREHERVSK